MFVGLMSDLRKNVAQFFFRAQFGPPQPQRRAPQRLQYSGPTLPGGGVAARAAHAARQQGAAQQGAAAVDELGMASTARTGGSAGLGAGGLASGPDPRTLATNRGEERTRTPVNVEKAPGRNDPCPCGSGKKFEKCHGR